MLDSIVNIETFSSSDFFHKKIKYIFLKKFQDLL